MATADSSGLVRNTDFSAELLLNKVMNQTYRTENGKTLTLAGRINAAKMDSQAFQYGIQAENLAKAQTVVNATQDALTEVVAMAKKIQSSEVDSSSASRAKLAAELRTELTEKVKTVVEGLSILSSGNSSTVGLGLGSGVMTIAPSAATDGGLGAINSLSSALSSLSVSSATADRSLINSIIEDLYGAIAVEGAKAELINNRYDTLNDIARSYKEATDDQVVTQGGSPTSLLNALL